MSEASKEIDPKVLEKHKVQRVLCIYYSTHFDEFSVKALIDSKSTVNVILLSSVKKQGFHICTIDLYADKIDGSKLETHGSLLPYFR